MTAPYVLARTMGDAHKFAQETLGLARGYYRVVTSPSSIKGPHGADLHLVPGWEMRFDRFSMKGAIRWTRLTVVDHSLDEVEAPVLDGLEPAGEQLSLVDAGDFFEGLTEEPETEDEAPAEEPETKRRRRRCKECGILVEPDEVESHAAEHLPVEA